MFLKEHRIWKNPGRQHQGLMEKFVDSGTKAAVNTSQSEVPYFIHWKKIVLWRVFPLLDNFSINTFPKHTPWTIEGHPLLGNGPINTQSWQQKTVFTVGSVPRSYKIAQSDVVQIRIEGAQRNTAEFCWKFPCSVQSEEDDIVSDSDLWTVVTSCIKVQ
jgi:hypothetical protein